MTHLLLIAQILTCDPKAFLAALRTITEPSVEAAAAAEARRILASNRACGYMALSWCEQHEGACRPPDWDEREKEP